MADETWVTRLSGKEREAAVVELQLMLARALSKFDAPIEDKEDFVQTATLKILTNMATFKSASKFSTWAISIVINTALSEMRKKHWSNVSLESVADFESHSSCRSNAEQDLQYNWVVELVDSLIEKDLTERQRTALLAELAGMPLQEIGSRMNVSKGAIYKLTFDARKKLLKCLEERNLNLADLVTALE